MAVGQWDESKHRRGQPGNKGEFGPGGGGASAKQPVATPEGIARVKDKFPELFSDKDRGARPSPTKKGDTSSKAFKEWFGDSKVVDKNGKPLVMYHGTVENFDSFDPDKTGSSIDQGWYGKGAYFATDPKAASGYATYGADSGQADGARVMMVYLSIKNPLVIEDDGKEEETLQEKMRELGMDPTGNPGRDTEILKRAGYDGIFVKDKSGSMEVTAFEASQVKSVSNEGTWSKDSHNIHASDLSTAIRAEKLARRIEKVLAKDSDRSAKAIIRDAANNVLVIKDRTYGTWELPGGHLQDGENFDRGLHREVKEETGLEILGETWRHSANHGRSEVFDASVAGIKPRVTLSDEHTDYKWVKPEEAEELAAFWFQDHPGNVPGSSRTSFYPQTGPAGVPGHQNAAVARERVRQEAEIEVAKAVARIVTLAEAEVLAGKANSDDFWAYAAATFFGAIMAAYGQAASELAVLEGQDSRADDAESKAHAEQRAELLKDFPKRVKARLKVAADEGRAAGESESDLHKRIGLVGDEILQGEGRIVAETEAQAVTGAATLRALKRAGFETAIWVTVGDDRVRETHLANEAQGEVKLGDKFSNGCRFPGDPLAPLSETINCRCWLVGSSRKEQV